MDWEKMLNALIEFQVATQGTAFLSSFYRDHLKKLGLTDKEFEHLINLQWKYRD